MTINDEITINGVKFTEIPCICSVCKFYLGGKNDTAGFCMMFHKQKRKFDNIPSRCKKLFEKGFALGGDLVIVNGG